MPPLSLPKISLMANIITDAFVIAVVIFATNISMAKMFAKKYNYKVDANQVNDLFSIWWVQRGEAVEYITYECSKPFQCYCIS
jgi:hypothetical protein